MADKTYIEWTDATWNVITGCSVVSPGCTNCYAMKLAGTRLQHHPSRAGLTLDSKAGPVWNGQVRFNADWLDQPLRWTKPRMIFVCAHGDLFHEGVTDDQLDRIFAVMALTPHHTYQVLTKRPERMAAYLAAPGSDGKRTRHAAISDVIRSWGREMPSDFWFMQHIWLGFSAEDQTRWDERWPIFREISGFGPKWASLEPLLSAIDLRVSHEHCDLCGGTGLLARWPKGPCHVCAGKGRVAILGPSTRTHYPKLDWIVVGGESGPGARPMHPDWARQLRDQCAAAGVPFFFKQWGDWGPVCELDTDALDSRLYHPAPKRRSEGWRRPKTAQTVLHANGDRFDDVAARGAYQSGSGAMLMFDIGKTVTGRTLDGRLHDGFPRQAPSGGSSPRRPDADHV